MDIIMRSVLEVSDMGELLVIAIVCILILTALYASERSRRIAIEDAYFKFLVFVEELVAQERGDGNLIEKDITEEEETTQGLS